VTNRERLMRQLAASPRDSKVDDRKVSFENVNIYCTARDGWTTSVPGESEVRFECLPDSPLPAELRSGAGFKLDGRLVRLPPYDVVADGAGERVTGAGIVRVLRYAFDLVAGEDQIDQKKKAAPKGG
jgi:hypothetical protein